MDIPRVIIVGCGFGGINAAKTLKNTQAQILLIDKANHHVFQPLLYQVATATLAPSNIAVPIRNVLEKQKNTTVFLADIVKVDKEHKKVIAGNGDEYVYDFLILAPGTMHSYFNHPEWENYAPGLKNLNDAITIRERILLSYERAERCSDPKEVEKFTCFVIVGAGPTGVEMAGAIGEIAHQTLTENFRRINTRNSKIYLIEGAKQVLPAFPKDLADKAQMYLEELGVEVLLETFVTDITSEGVWLGDKFIETPNIIWAAGNEGSPLLKSLDVPLDKSKRVIVNRDLTIPGYPEIFVIGDAGCLIDDKGNSLPGLAPVAIQQGKYVAKIIHHQVPADKRKPFVYYDKGMMAAIGQTKAIAITGKLKLSGFLAWLAWSTIHICYLISYSNRLFVMIQWIYLYIFHERQIQLITGLISEKMEPINRQNKEICDP